MANDPARMERLALASGFCMFDKRLRSSGNGSIIWGLLNAFLGFATLNRNQKWGAVSLALGIALIAAGIYQRRVRDPKVIVISAATLAGLAVWDFALIALAALGTVKLAFGGRTLFWAIAQLWGAFATWKTYSTYKMLHEKSDPLMVGQIRGYIDELKKVKPDQSIDLIEFEANAGFLETSRRYRLKPIDDLYFLVKYKSELGSLSLEEVDFVPRATGECHSRR